MLSSPLLLSLVNNAFPHLLNSSDPSPHVRHVYSVDQMTPRDLFFLARELAFFIQSTLGSLYTSHSHLLYHPLTRSRTWLSHKIAELQEPGLYHIVYRTTVHPDSSIACFISLVVCEHPSDLRKSQVLYILEIHVIKRLQRQKLGQYLLSKAHCLALSISKSFVPLTGLALTVFSDNHAAYSLYNSVGYRSLAISDLPRELTVMCCPLEGSNSDKRDIT